MLCLCFSGVFWGFFSGFFCELEFFFCWAVVCFVNSFSLLTFVFWSFVFCFFFAIILSFFSFYRCCL